MEQRSNWKTEIGSLVFAGFIILCFSSGTITYREGEIGFNPSKAVGLAVGLFQAFAEVVRTVDQETVEQ